MQDRDDDRHGERGPQHEPQRAGHPRQCDVPVDEMRELVTDQRPEQVAAAGQRKLAGERDPVVARPPKAERLALRRRADKHAGRPHALGDRHPSDRVHSGREPLVGGDEAFPPPDEPRRDHDDRGRQRDDDKRDAGRRRGPGPLYGALA